MKVSIEFTHEAKRHTVFKGDVTVVYCRNCVVSIVAQHKDENGEYTCMTFDHPIKYELTEHEEYPVRRLWVNPVYDYSMIYEATK